MGYEYVVFEGVVLQRTARGVLFQGHYWEAPLWLPTSQTLHEPDGDMACVMGVKSWLASKKGLSEFTQYSEEEIKLIAGV
jgi:hypothetical protein